MLVEMFKEGLKPEIVAANLELPFSTRVHNPHSENKTTIKTEYVLKNGSHHGFGLEALFAHELEKFCANNHATIDKIKKIESSNLSVLAEDPGNLAAILECLPDKNGAEKLIHHVFEGKCEGKIKNSAFAYFAKNNDIIELETITPSHTLLAHIFTLLQANNRVDASEKLSRKLEYVLADKEEA